MVLRRVLMKRRSGAANTRRSTPDPPDAIQHQRYAGRFEEYRKLWPLVKNLIRLGCDE